jgi:hypothetical protein
MATKEQNLIEMMEMISYLRRENMDITSIMQILKEQKMFDLDMTTSEVQTFLSQLTNVNIENFSNKEDILIEDFLNELDRFEDFDFFEDSKTKRYLN